LKEEINEETGKITVLEKCDFYEEKEYGERKEHYCSKLKKFHCDLYDIEERFEVKKLCQIKCPDFYTYEDWEDFEEIEESEKQNTDAFMDALLKLKKRFKKKNKDWEDDEVLYAEFEKERRILGSTVLASKAEAKEIAKMQSTEQHIRNCDEAFKVEERKYQENGGVWEK